MVKNKIAFAKQKNPEFIVELRNEVNAYFERNNVSRTGAGTLVFKAIIMLSLFLLPYLLMLSGISSSLAFVWICWILTGIGMAGVGMSVMHDANHRSFSKSTRVNRWFGNTLYLLGGFPPNWQYQHNTLHHGFPNIEGMDEDIDPGAYLRFSPHKPLYKIYRYQQVYAWFLYGLMTLSWVLTKDFMQLNRYRQEGINLGGKRSYPQLFLLLTITKAMYYGAFIVIPLIFLPFAWYWIPVFFISMHFACGLILTTVFQTAHVMPSSEYPLPDGKGNMENNWAVHQLRTTSDFAPGNRLLSWFIGGLNFQVEHHLFPNISHVHYRKISVIVAETTKKYGLPYHVQPSFLTAVYNHARMLKMLGHISPIYT